MAAKNVFSYVFFIVLLGLFVSFFNHTKNETNDCYINKIARVNQNIVDYCK